MWRSSWSARAGTIRRQWTHPNRVEIIGDFGSTPESPCAAATCLRAEPSDENPVGRASRVKPDITAEQITGINRKSGGPGIETDKDTTRCAWDEDATGARSRYGILLDPLPLTIGTGAKRKITLDPDLLIGIGIISETVHLP
jgi:hypothetical protein